MSRTKNFQTKKRWVYLNKEKAKFTSAKISPVVCEILSNRGIETEKEALNFIDPDYAKLSDPFLLPDMAEAVKVVLAAVERNEKITIYGDYDVDGISSTALLIRFFREIGVEVDYYIPSRQDEGYGLNVKAIEEIAKRGTRLIITVDCGSTSVTEIQKAKKLGMEVVVTDHHVFHQEAGKDVLPDALVINHKRRESKLKQELAGVGVAFYLVRALQQELGEKFAKGREKWLLDLVALGTICDVVPLVDDNRILAKFGLTVLSKTKNSGIRALVGICGFEIKDVESYKVGFLLGPRLNAAGRIDHAEAALKLLITDESKEALEIAEKLNILNKERQETTERIVNEAREIIGTPNLSRKILVLAKENWPAGVAGIVASRLVEEYGRPALVMEALGSELKGSARSINRFNIVEALAACSDHLIHYGGHAYAAGFKLKKEHFVALDEKLLKISDKAIKEEDLVPEIVIDGELESDELSLDLVKEIEMLEPFGSANYSPVFSVKKAEILDFRLVGNPGVHLKLSLKKGETVFSAIGFNFGEECDFKIGQTIDIACHLERNVWNNRESLDAKLIDLVK